MSLEYVANEDVTIDHAAGSTVSGGSFTVTSVASTKVKAEGKGVFYGATISFTFSGGNEATCAPGTVTGSGTITTTAQKVKVEGAAPLREGDSGTMNWTGTNATPPPPTNAGVSAVEVTAAGQTTVKAQ